MAAIQGEFVAPLQPGSVLPSTALFRYVEALQDAPNAEMLYGDEDEIDARGERYRPWFKPLWNEEMAFAQDYVSGACAIRAETFRRARAIARQARSAAPFALALETAAKDCQAPMHVPHVQCHRTCVDNRDDQSARRAVLERWLADRGAEVSTGSHGLLRVDWPLPMPMPLVSIVVPTRDKLGLLRTCVSGLLDETTYVPMEIVIVDNGSREANTLEYLAGIADNPVVRVIRDNRSFNFSRLNNMAVSRARGEMLCFLNNDTEVIDGHWLSEMVRQAVRPEVGAVGAKLLYDDDSIQHAGVVVGMGDAAGHAHRFQRSGDLGYFHRADIPHFVSAVTAACLVVQKSKFEAVGGFDEEHLAVAFNDVDLCLKLESRGWRNLYQPRAVLLHHESKSRGKDISPQHIDRYKRELHVLQTRWSTFGRVDPLHHPMLDRSSETYLLRL
jgi:GT2 family glycosyltransferase